MAPITSTQQAGQAADIEQPQSAKDMVGLIIISSLILAYFVGVVVLALFHRHQRRPYRRIRPSERPAERHPYAKKLSLLRTTSNLSEKEGEQQEKNEVQRDLIIQKSLAIRASSSASSRVSQSSDEDSDNEDSQSLKSDWKDFEAGLKREPSLSLKHHPSLKPSTQRPVPLDNHPAFRHMRSTSSPLAMPAPVRTSSPLRSVITPPPRVRFSSPPPYTSTAVNDNHRPTAPCGVRSERPPPPRRSTFSIASETVNEGVEMPDKI